MHLTNTGGRSTGFALCGVNLRSLDSAKKQSLVVGSGATWCNKTKIWRKREKTDVQRCSDPTNKQQILRPSVACPFQQHCPSQVFGTMEDLQRVVDQGIEGILELHKAALKTS